MGDHRSAVGRTKGLYMYSISPFYQRPFRGFFKESTHMFREHLGWGIFFSSLAIGAYSLVKWANADFHRRGLKNPADYENEVIEN